MLFMWPSDVERPIWTLTAEESFGYGTTYDNLFYYAFCIRQGCTKDLFLLKCRNVLDNLADTA